ncbi:MAG: PKD domain-containing protein, partial [Flavobacteriales bacterium]|nr:PKD domain-containing protein [Flavobacteriales bacterium]
DGLAFQYSLDQGATWTNVGQAGGTVHCLNTNWYNTAYVNHLTLADPRQGWTGRVGPTQGSCAGGQGSNGWANATHCLDQLAGEPLVKFRFVFGAGTTCNSYDGVAIDDFRLGEAPPNEASFIHACGDGAVDFLSTSAWCPALLSWDFGDPASGAMDQATGAAPSHTFSAPGTYTVTLTAQGPCNAPSTTVQTVAVPGVTIDAVQPGCGGSDGVLTAQVQFADGPVSYLWSPGGQTTAQIDGQAPGTYTVQVSVPGSCPVEATAVLQPATDGLQIDLQTTPESCFGAHDGTVQAVVSGGTAPITYTWTPALPGGAQVTGLAPGTYALTVTDADGCSAIATATITGPAPMLVTAPPDTVLCAGAWLDLAPQVSGGTAPVTLSFQPAGPMVQPAQATVYTIIATDAHGCAAPPVQVAVDVVHPERPAITMVGADGCAPFCVALAATGPADAQYHWDLGNGATASGAQVAPCFAQAGTYLPVLTLTDVHGCVAQAEAPGTITVHPAPLAAFTADPPITVIGRPTVTFTAEGSGAASWTWDFGEGPVPGGPVMAHTFSTVGCRTVRLRTENNAGCADEAEAVYCVEDDFTLFVPNAFTPDGDGINDVLAVITTVRDPAWFRLTVLDRWGTVLFTTDDPHRGWDGTAGAPVPPGIYLWQVAITDVAGHLHQASGHVTLLR